MTQREKRVLNSWTLLFAAAEDWRTVEEMPGADQIMLDILVVKGILEREDYPTRFRITPVGRLVARNMQPWS